MQIKRYNLWQPNEYRYPMAFGFIPNITAFIHDEDNHSGDDNLKIRPGMLIVPGGGYRVVSPSEGEIVARKFYHMGYQTFVCTYTTNLLGAVPLKMQPMQDLSRAVRFIRKNAEEFRVMENKLILCGFSAGAHLCGSLCMHFNDVTDQNPEFGDVNNRPDAAILSYPVITSGFYAHKDSFTALLGDDSSEEERNYMSLEKQVNRDTPPCFIWQTAEDELVPVQNSYLLADALHRQGILYAHHVFSKGKHGLSLADEAWARGEYGQTDTMEQVTRLIKLIKSGEMEIPEPAGQQLLNTFDLDEEAGKELLKGNIPSREVAVWPVLADEWLKNVMRRADLTEYKPFD